MAESVLVLVIEKIGIALAKGTVVRGCSQFFSYVKKLKEIQGTMGGIERELHVIQCVLSERDIRNRNNKVYESWLDGVMKVGHAMEDMVDEYLDRVDREHSLGCCFYVKTGFLEPRYFLSFNRIASGMKKIEKDLTQLSEIKNRWVPVVNNNGDASNSNYIVKSSQDQADISRFLNEEDLVGVDENRAKLEQWLGDDGANHSLVTLVGMGGIGKTALAANVYRKEREKFDCRAWVSISQSYSIVDVLRSIIKQVYKDEFIDPPNLADMEITSLRETLKRFLEQRKYLIIMDDVWTPEAFIDLSRTLICNVKGRILITTRQGDVAALASQGHMIALEVLPEDKAWDLFCKESFPRETGHECPEELKSLSEEIVTKCKGLPLAIVSVGSLLHVREKSVEEWRRINDQLSWEIINNPRLGHIRNVLYLSFIYLPEYLRSCLLYCSLFPEDYLFHRKQLVRLWTAEGFIIQRGASTLEEVAEGYLKDLVNRNMLQLVDRNSFGRMKGFKMHDILRELAVDLCQKNHFGAKYEEDKCGGHLQRGERRLVLHKLNKDIQKSFSGVHGLRSFIGLDKSTPSVALLPLLSQKARYMTVLELSGLPIEKIPDSIGNLFNLRYFGLRNSRVKLLPKSIEKLSNLLTLDLCTSEIKELPAGIVKLKNLRHLFAQKLNDQHGSVLQFFNGVCITKGLGNLKNLQTLQSLEIEDGSVRQLGELRQLRSLRIWNVKSIYCEGLCEALVQMPFLSNLDVGASDENEILRLNAPLPNLQKLCLNGRLAEETSLRESPLFQAMEQNLHSLYLRWSQLREDPLPSLSRLANLTVLLLNCAYNGEKLEFLTGWFPMLKDLYLLDLPNLELLEIHQDAMVKLETLYLRNLKSMMEVPPGLEFLLPLETLIFYGISVDFLTVLRQCSRLVGVRWSHTLRD